MGWCILDPTLEKYCRYSEVQEKYLVRKTAGWKDSIQHPRQHEPGSDGATRTESICSAYLEDGDQSLLLHIFEGHVRLDNAPADCAWQLLLLHHIRTPLAVIVVSAR